MSDRPGATEVVYVNEEDLAAEFAGRWRASLDAEQLDRLKADFIAAIRRGRVVAGHLHTGALSTAKLYYPFCKACTGMVRSDGYCAGCAAFTGTLFIRPVEK